ncbi:hypothetical protein XthCFBP4691_20975, partial [Xanthomonas theicola]
DLWNADTAMRTGRPKAELVLSDHERSPFESFARSLFGRPRHRTGGFKLSTAPFSIEKLREVVGLYLS